YSVIPALYARPSSNKRLSIAALAAGHVVAQAPLNSVRPCARLLTMRLNVLSSCQIAKIERFTASEPGTQFFGGGLGRWIPACEPVNLSQLRPHPEEPERSEGVSKDGLESELAAMVRDGAHRSQVYAGCACYGAPPHHEAERVELVLNRQDLKDSQALARE